MTTHRYQRHKGIAQILPCKHNLIQHELINITVTKSILQAKSATLHSLTEKKIKINDILYKLKKTFIEIFVLQKLFEQKKYSAKNKTLQYTLENHPHNNFNKQIFNLFKSLNGKHQNRSKQLWTAIANIEFGLHLYKFLITKKCVKRIKN